jgi:hypothetical protein
MHVDHEVPIADVLKAPPCGCSAEDIYPADVLAKRKEMTVTPTSQTLKSATVGAVAKDGMRRKAS